MSTGQEETAGDTELAAQSPADDGQQAPKAEVSQPADPEASGTPGAGPADDPDSKFQGADPDSKFQG
jgi:hypothetical protein